MADLEILLSVEQLSEVEVREEGAHIEGCYGVERRNDTEGWDDLKIVIAFEDISELSALGSNTQVCKTR